MDMPAFLDMRPTGTPNAGEDLDRDAVVATTPAAGVEGEAS
jgi:hypothetical protein